MATTTLPPMPARPHDALRDVRRAVAAGVHDLPYELKTIVARYPMLALPLQSARGHGEVVGDTTDIVIEGFPRCASSFAVAAFRLAQEPRAMTIANHTHMPAQVIEGVRRGIPTLMLIRPAEDAVVSLLIRNPELSVRAALRGYLRFYMPLLPDARRFVTATFDEVVHDLARPIERLNSRYGTSFAPFVHSAENLARIDREIEDDYRSRAQPSPGAAESLERIIPRPSESREALKDSVRRRFAEQAPKTYRRRATTVYARLTTT